MNSIKGKIIMSFSPSVDYTRLIDGKEQIRKDCWLYKLVEDFVGKDKITENNFSFLGRDTIHRLEFATTDTVFSWLKVQPLFILKAEELRRLRYDGHPSLLHYLCTPMLIVFDNDLDK